MRFLFQITDQFYKENTREGISTQLNHGAMPYETQTRLAEILVE